MVSVNTTKCEGRRRLQRRLIVQIQVVCCIMYCQLAWGSNLFPTGQGFSPGPNSERETEILTYELAATHGLTEQEVVEKAVGVLWSFWRYLEDERMSIYVADKNLGGDKAAVNATIHNVVEGRVRTLRGTCSILDRGAKIIEHKMKLRSRFLSSLGRRLDSSPDQNIRSLELVGVPGVEWLRMEASLNEIPYSIESLAIHLLDYFVGKSLFFFENRDGRTSCRFFMAFDRLKS